MKRHAGWSTCPGACLALLTLVACAGPPADGLDALGSFPTAPVAGVVSEVPAAPQRGAEEQGPAPSAAPFASNVAEDAAPLRPTLSPSAYRVREERVLRIYGDDDRREVVGSQSLIEIAAQAPTGLDPGAWAQAVQARARAVALVVGRADVAWRDDGSVAILSRALRVHIREKVGADPCPGRVPFVDQPTAGHCTAWLAAPNIVVTAGHCALSRSAKDLVFVFGWRGLSDVDERSTSTLVPGAVVVAGKRTIARRLDGSGLDFSVIELERVLSEDDGLSHLAMRRSGRPIREEPLYLLGCPRGLPVKFAGNAEVQAVHVRDPLLRANVDAFSGNSGSPVLSATTHEVVGILIRGRSDFATIPDERGGVCAVEVRIPDSVRGETILGCVAFADFIP